MTITMYAVLDRAAAFDELLSRVAGSLPDELVSGVRASIQADDLVASARALAFAVVAVPLVLSGPDAGLLTETLAEVGDDVTAMLRDHVT